MSRTILYNGKLIFPDMIREDSYVIVKNGKIESMGEGYPECGEEDLLINVENKYISPGFIDIHTHGAGGHDFMDGTVEAYLTIAATHARYGTTGLLVTTLTSTDEELYKSFDIYRQAKEQNISGAAFLGIHLEGPYFSYNQRGAQDPKYLRTPVPAEYNKILDASPYIVRWSIAPELEGAIELGKELERRNILASVGHTDAIYEEVVQAYDAGYSLMTHLYSCMSTITRKNAFRYAGALEAAYMIDGMYVEVIADGIHVPKSLLQFVCKFKGAGRIALVTDSMRAAGMPDGRYMLGSLCKGQEVIVEDGVAKIPDRTAFAGSVATADRLVRTMINIAEIPLTEAIKMLTVTPACILKIDHKKGSLKEGKDADIILFDENIQVDLTMVEGRIIYKRDI